MSLRTCFFGGCTRPTPMSEKITCLSFVAMPPPISEPPVFVPYRSLVSQSDFDAVQAASALRSSDGSRRVLGLFDSYGMLPRCTFPVLLLQQQRRLRRSNPRPN